MTERTRMQVYQANAILSAIGTLQRALDEYEEFDSVNNPFYTALKRDLDSMAVAPKAIVEADAARRRAEYEQKMATPVDLGPRLGQVDRRKRYTLVVRVMDTRRTTFSTYETYDTGKRQTLKGRQPIYSSIKTEGEVGASLVERGSSEWRSAGGQNRRLDIVEIESVTEEVPDVQS